MMTSATKPKIILYMAVSLDGFIAGMDDDVEWVTEQSWQNYTNLLKEVGLAVVGRNTYEMMRDDEFLSECTYLVLTSRDSIKDRGLVNVERIGSPTEAVQYAQDNNFQSLCVIGGGKTNTTFLKEGFLDELILDVHPVVLGTGLLLFPGNDASADLKLLGIKDLGNNLVQLHYSVESIE